MSYNSLPVFVSSSDSYSFLWPAFFTLFKRYWPQFEGVIYLNTEEMEFSFPGLNIVSTKVGKQKYFGATFKKGLAKIPDKYFLLMMIDYFVECPVDVNAIEGIFNAFRCDEGVDSVTLFAQGARLKPVDACRSVCEMIPPSRFVNFSFQTAIWRKDRISKYIAGWESPWYAEYFGCYRADILKTRLWCLAPDAPMPIKYDGSGVLHGGGRWYRPALEKLDLDSIPLEMGDRAFFVEPRFPRLARIPKEIPLLHLRALSYLSLFKCLLERFKLMMI